MSYSISKLNGVKRGRRNSSLHVSLINKEDPECSHPLYFSTHAKEKANEACPNAKDEEGGGGGGGCEANQTTLSSLSFCAGVQFSHDSISASSSTIIYKYEKKEGCEQSKENPLQLFFDIVHCFFLGQRTRIA